MFQEHRPRIPSGSNISFNPLRRAFDDFGWKVNWFWPKISSRFFLLFAFRSVKAIPFLLVTHFFVLSVKLLRWSCILFNLGLNHCVPFAIIGLCWFGHVPSIFIVSAPCLVVRQDVYMKSHVSCTKEIDWSDETHSLRSIVMQMFMQSLPYTWRAKNLIELNSCTA